MQSCERRHTVHPGCYGQVRPRPGVSAPSVAQFAASPDVSGSHLQMNRLHYLWASRAPLWAARRYWRGKVDPTTGTLDMLWEFIIDSRESAHQIVELEHGHQLRAAKAALRKELGLLAFPIFWFVSVRSLLKGRG